MACTSSQTLDQSAKEIQIGSYDATVTIRLVKNTRTSNK